MGAPEPTITDVMGIAAKGPEEYPLGDLTPERFEDLVFLLARGENSDVRHVRAKDHGLDARLPDRGGRTLRGWQAKRFTGAIKWDQCQESVSRALPWWRPLRITFGFPKRLSGDEQMKFRKNLIEKFPQVRIDWWDHDELQRRMRDTEDGRRAAAWLFSHPDADRAALLRALAVGGELANAGQAAARAAEIQTFVDRDPHFRYTVVSASADTPETPRAPQTLLSVEAEIDGRRVRFDASERYPGARSDAGLEGQLLFSDDDEGRRARAAFDSVLKDGGTVSVESGMSAEFVAVPVGLRGLLPEDPVSGEVEITAVEDVPQSPPSSQPGLPMLVRAGDAELGLVFNPAEPPAGSGHAIAGSAGGLELFISLGDRPGERKPQMDWRWRLGEGDALAQLLACEVMLNAYRGELVELINPTDSSIGASAKLEEPGDSADLAELEDVRSFLSYVAEAEAWLGVPLEPSSHPSKSDAAVLSELIGRIRDPHYTGTWDRVEVELNGPPPTEEDAWALVLLQPLYAELFGAQRYLGTERLHMPKARYERLTGDEAAGDHVTMVPAEDARDLDVRFYSPVEVPEAATRPRGSAGEGAGERGSR
jgi:hypothetical protein